MNQMHDKELLKGTLQTIILQLLDRNGEMYGYQITGHVRELSDGKILLTEGALYPALHKLEAEGLLVTRQEKRGKRIRKYYALTANGKSVVHDKVDEFLSFIHTMRSVLELKAL